MPVSDHKVGRKLLGLAEWYGNPIWSLNHDQRRVFSEKAKLHFKKADQKCPFFQRHKAGAICNKKGGTCTFMLHEVISVDDVKTCKPIEGAGIVTCCPNRLWENLTVFEHICKTVLQAKDLSECRLVKEVDFLHGTTPVEIEGSETEEPSTIVDTAKAETEVNVGRIDMVLMRLDSSGNIADWCAVEMQAVYFSGDEMPSYLAGLGEHPVLTAPIGSRRPDYRSSGPKRLMPQLQVKVPGLRRWGKKMVVVVDRRFYGSFGSMKKSNHVTNSDIIWCIVDYDLIDSSGNKTDIPANVVGTRLRVDEDFPTTLESSIEGLIAGETISRDLFEQRMIKKKKKWIHLST